MLKFEEYLSDFTNTVNVLDFIIGLLVAAVLSLVLKYFYIRYASSISNREKFASNFVPLALTTMLVISVVQASIALSLGLVGALSIVRFRAAIKEPEELTYLFLSIAIGLVAGANKPLLAVLAMAVILPLIYLNRIFRSESGLESDHLFVNIKSKGFKLDGLSQVLASELSFVELKRMDENSDGMFASFRVKATDPKQLDGLIQKLRAEDPELHISIVEQARLVL